MEADYKYQKRVTQTLFIGGIFQSRFGTHFAAQNLYKKIPLPLGELQEAYLWYYGLKKRWPDYLVSEFLNAFWATMQVLLLQPRVLCY